MAPCTWTFLSGLDGRRILQQPATGGWGKRQVNGPFATSAFHREVLGVRGRGGGATMSAVAIGGPPGGEETGARAGVLRPLWEPAVGFRHLSPRSRP